MALTKDTSTVAGLLARVRTGGTTIGCRYVDHLCYSSQPRCKEPTNNNLSGEPSKTTFERLNLPCS